MPRHRAVFTLAFIVTAMLAGIVDAAAQAIPQSVPAEIVGGETNQPGGYSRVEFPSIDGPTLQGYLFRPKDSGAAPRPAVVMMHGCSGLMNPRSGRFFPLYMPWVQALNAEGYVVLVVDSATSRGLGQTCNGANASAMWRERPKDAYAALVYLQAQPFVKADRIALMGWSQGGGVALIAINERTTGKLSPRGREFMAGLPSDFRAAVAFYPGACSGFAQGMTYPPGETQGWTSHIPLLVLFGDADVWTPLAPCKVFLDAAIARGNPITLQVYPGAYHAFDAPDMKRLTLPQYRLANGDVPILQTDPAARADAFRRVEAFLAERLR